MPLPENLKIKPSSGGGSVSVGEGIFSVEIVDISYIEADQTKYGKPQLNFRFRILKGGYEGAELQSWASCVLSPGWEGGNPSNLYLLACAVLGEEVDLEKEFDPNVLMGGKLTIVVELRRTKGGKEYSKITKYLKREALPESKSEDVEVPEDVGEEVDRAEP